MQYNTLSNINLNSIHEAKTTKQKWKFDPVHGAKQKYRNKNNGNSILA
jgi:hypothetical protein